jgi:hypothetical protein
MALRTKKKHFQTRTERPPAPADVGGDAAVHPRGRVLGHHELGLPRLRHVHRAGAHFRKLHFGWTNFGARAKCPKMTPQKIFNIGLEHFGVLDVSG